MTSYRRYHDEEYRPNTQILKALYRPPFSDSVASELNYLVRAYGTEIRLGKAHPAPCSAWRAERSLQDPSKDWDARFANRVHLFAGARHLPGQDDPKSQIGPTQRYLGYVSLRPIRATVTSPLPYPLYTTVAMLVPPPYMMRPRFHVITCVAGPTEGVLPFRSAPFFSPASPEQDRMSAPCMHAALHAALMLKASLFHCRPISSLEMVTLIWEMDHDQQRLPPIRDTQRDGVDPRRFFDWLKQGLSLEQALDVLEHPQVRSGGVLEFITEHSFLRAETPEERRSLIALEALRCLTDYVANGIPVLLEISPPGIPDMGHAVLLIGLRLMADPDDDRWPIPDDHTDVLRRIDMKELPSKFVVHDSLKGPYQVIATPYLLKRAFVESSPGEDSNDTEQEGIRFLALMPIQTKIGIQQVRDYSQLLVAQHRFSAAYLQEQLHCNDVATTAHDEPSLKWLDAVAGARYICRCLRARQIVRRYMRAKEAENESREMVNARTLLRKVLHSYQKQYEENIAQFLGPGEIDPIALHWWCVEVRAPQQPSPPSRQDADDSTRNEAEGAIPPLVIYLWPVNMEHELARQGPPIRIEYTEGDKAELIFAPALGQRERVLTFDQWRPTDG